MVGGYYYLGKILCRAYTDGVGTVVLYVVVETAVLLVSAVNDGTERIPARALVVGNEQNAAVQLEYRSNGRLGIARSTRLIG